MTARHDIARATDAAFGAWDRTSLVDWCWWMRWGRPDNRRGCASLEPNSGQGETDGIGHHVQVDTCIVH
jgi:hypothetical protein